MRIEHKASLATISIIISIAIGFGAFFLRYAKNEGEGHLREKGLMLARGLARNSEYGVLIQDHLMLSQLMNNIMREEGVIYAIIQDKGDKVLLSAISPHLEINLEKLMRISRHASLGEKPQPMNKIFLNRNPVLDIGYPITIPRERKLTKEEMLFEEIKELTLEEDIPAGERIGYIRLGMSLKPMAQKIQKIRRTITLFTMIMISVTTLIIIVWARVLLRPLKKLVKVTHLIAQGNLNETVKVKSRDEIGEFAQSFNIMVRELKRTQEKLIQSSKLAGLGQLAAGVAHEINNPLTAVLGYAQLIKINLPVEKYGERLSHILPNLAKHMDMIENAALRCKSIVEKLLIFSRFPSEDCGPLDINQVIEDTFALLQAQMEVNNIQVIKELSPSLPQILGTPNKLQQVFTNIIINAKQAMPQGGFLKVYTKPNNASNSIKIIFSDTGCGIKREHMDKIFDPFFSTKEVGEGTGLGLSVSYGIIKDHAGEIKVKSQEGKGTSFIISLPIGKFQ